MLSQGAATEPHHLPTIREDKSANELTLLLGHNSQAASSSQEAHTSGETSSSAPLDAGTLKLCEQAQQARLTPCEGLVHCIRVMLQDADGYVLSTHQSSSIKQQHAMLTHPLLTCMQKLNTVPPVSLCMSLSCCNQYVLTPVCQDPT